jgi:hypothetical protein
VKPYTEEQKRRKRAKRNARRLGMTVDEYLEKAATHRRCDGGRKGSAHWALKEFFRMTLSGPSRTCTNC